MKNLFKQVVILCLAVCSLLTFASCNNPADEFAGEYETFDYPYRISISSHDLDGLVYLRSDCYSITKNGCYYKNDNNELVLDEIEIDVNLVKAINDYIDMVGNKVKLTNKDVLFCGTDKKFNIKNYEYIRVEESDPLNVGVYIFSTEDKNFTIRIDAAIMKDVGDIKSIGIAFENKIVATDGIEYEFYFSMRLKLK